jgi:S-DNA-T family DNA segregation ATPase FtsK/SpoIIIE
MGVVTTIPAGAGPRDIVRILFLGFVHRNLVAWSVILMLGGLVRRPLIPFGLGLSVWLIVSGLGLLPAALLGAVPEVAWRSRRGWKMMRALAPPKGGLAWRHDLFESWRRYRNLMALWPQAADNVGLSRVVDDVIRVPHLSNVHATEWGLTADINTAAFGVPASRLASKAEIIATSLDGCRFVQVVPGETPQLATLHMRWTDPLSETIPLERLPLPATGRLAFGLTESGAAATIATIKSLLIVGVPGSGKSGTLWALMASAIASGIPFRLWVLDPHGGVELSTLSGSPLVRQYCNDGGKPAEQMIGNMYDAMVKRMETMDDTGRYHVPTEDAPWEILVIDEFLALDGVLSNTKSNKLRHILSAGRKAAFTVWALTQVPQLDTVGGLRRMFVQKLVLATESSVMTDVVLGPGAENQGARCSQIPESMPGVGYAHLEFGGGFERFRTVWVPDSVIPALAAGLLPPEVPTRDEFAEDKWSELLEGQPHVLYEWRYRPAGNALLYAGISNDGTRRATEHLESKKRPYLNRAGVAMEIAREFPTRSSALEYEARLIEQERPPLNRQHNPDNETVRTQKLKEILSGRES